MPDSAPGLDPGEAFASTFRASFGRLPLRVIQEESFLRSLVFRFCLCTSGTCARRTVVGCRASRRYLYHCTGRIHRSTGQWQAIDNPMRDRARMLSPRLYRQLPCLPWYPSGADSALRTIGRYLPSYPYLSRPSHRACPTKTGRGAFYSSDPAFLFPGLVRLASLDGRRLGLFMFRFVNEIRGIALE